MSPREIIAHYRITAKLGEGGMGEVWRATDSKLGREVAIKILPEAFARDPGRMARFEREAKVLASLNHPHIAQIYGVEDRALIMELIEGESPKGPMPFDEAWKIASQIAEALEYAHEKGVIHRDLKPANVKVTPDGHVKLLDFGLAKALNETGDASASDPENSPTITFGGTAVGAIVGTAAYMAPEQAKGKRVDKRCDIWAWGVVLYELLTGERLFEGETSADTMAQVLTKDPDLKRVPPPVRKLLQRCLEKDPKRRLRDIGDAQDFLEATALRAAAPFRSATVRERSTPWIIGTLAAALAFAMLAAIHFRERPPEPPPPVRLSVLPPEGSAGFVLGGNVGGSAISPDGRTLAFVAESQGKQMLYVRGLDSLEARVLPGTEGAARPFWSPDSRNLGFFAQSKLQRIALTGGAPTTICNVIVPRGATWGPDGTIVLSLARPSILARVSASGGQPQPLTSLDQGEFRAWPHFLPDGRHFLYLARGAEADKGVVYAGSVNDEPGATKRVRIVDSTFGAVYAASPSNARQGYLLFYQGSSLMAQAFEPGTLKLSGEAVPVAGNVGTAPGNGYMDVSASRTGVLVYGAQSQNSQRLVWIDRSGKQSEPLSVPGLPQLAKLSPDGGSAAVEIVQTNGRPDIWRIDVSRPSDGTRLTFGGFAEFPMWSPDGREIAYYDARTGLLRKAASGAGEASVVLHDSDLSRGADWSPDGKWLLFYRLQRNAPQLGLWAVPMDPEVGGKPFQYLGGVVQSAARFYPLRSGPQLVAYTAQEPGSGVPQIYVQDFPGAYSKWQVSRESGIVPVWSRDGRELFFLNPAGTKLMAAAVRAAGGSFEADTPHTLFDLSAVALGYDVSPDGKRFLFVVRDPNDRRALGITVVENWQAGLKK
jgi:Tol biopolymer transport system component